MSQGPSQTFDEKNFESEVLNNSQPVLVDFWAAWCGPCRIIGPVVEELATEFEGRAKVGKVNVDENPQLVSTYGIRGIPTLLVFQDGQVVDQIVGVVSKQQLAEKLASRLKRPEQT